MTLLEDAAAICGELTELRHGGVSRRLDAVAGILPAGRRDQLVRDLQALTETRREAGPA